MVQVQSGVARTGKWWGHQHMLGEDEQPDIMTFAKGIAAGFPFAGLAMKDSVKAVCAGRSQCAPPFDICMTSSETFHACLYLWSGGAKRFRSVCKASTFGR